VPVSEAPAGDEQAHRLPGCEIMSIVGKTGPSSSRGRGSVGP